MPALLVIWEFALCNLSFLGTLKDKQGWQHAPAGNKSNSKCDSLCVCGWCMNMDGPYYRVFKSLIWVERVWNGDLIHVDVVTWIFPTCFVFMNPMKCLDSSPVSWKCFCVVWVAAWWVNPILFVKCKMTKFLATIDLLLKFGSQWHAS
jgi:hypothetical protein